MSADARGLAFKGNS